MMHYSLLFICLFSFPLIAVEFAVVIPSYNNAKWVEQNLESVASQTYPHYHVYYVNDRSTDETGHMADAFVKRRKLEDKFTICHNEERAGCPLANFYKIISKLPPDVVVVNLDGDDRLAGPTVLEKLAKVYKSKKKKVWMTYGSFASEPAGYPNFCAPFPRHVLKENAFRSSPFISSHLRTFYAKLFQKIKKEDLFYQGKFCQLAGDVALMMPMLEMASKGHIHFMSDILYIYRIDNPLNEFRVDNNLLRVEIEKHVRALPRYKPLKKLF